MRTPRFFLAGLFLFSTIPALAQGPTPPCSPCVGVLVTDPAAAARALGELPTIAEDGRLYVAWEVPSDADPAAVARQATELEAAGATPWLRIVFTVSTPVVEHLPELEAELRAATLLARGAGPVTHFQVLWRPGGDVTAEEGAPNGVLDPNQYAFLYKRASVALSGARPEARVLTAPLPGSAAVLTTFYGEEVAAYIDGLALAAAGLDLAALAPMLVELDPGRPLVVDGIPFPAEPSLALAGAAEAARTGAAVAFFDLAEPTPDALRPLVTLANEFRGELAFDPYSTPTGGQGAWSFVRGSDLGLRVLVQAPAGGGPLRLTFPDPQLRQPERIDLATGEPRALFGLRRTAEGLEFSIDDPDPVTVLRLSRATAEELEGLSEELTVASERQVPVEEIVRRLQTFDDAQARKLNRFRAINTTHLRFQPSAGAGTIEVSFEGEFFFRQGIGSRPSTFDWAWQSLYINGVRWRGKSLPEIPLVQPEKAASMPLAIELSKRYSYRLRGSETIDGRDCWVVEFRPEGALAEKERLFRGAVWVDKELFARVQTRAVQLGLEGDVLSNEETVTFQPLDARGQPAPWAPGSYYLPVRTVAQQLLSILNTQVLVERQILLTQLVLNPPDFDERLAAALASDATMVRDTQAGLKYLVKEEGVEGRVVQEGFDTKKLFLVGGVFYDDALDFPLPLAGVNYFAFDVAGRDQQLNVFFAGALLTVDFADPSVFGSKWDAGADMLAVGFPFTNSLYRDNQEVLGEELESLSGNVSLLLGRPLGQFVKLQSEYELTYSKFDGTKNTDPAFVLPQDIYTQTFGLGLSYNRQGYGLAVDSSFNTRSDWQPWGLPGNPEFDQSQEDYLLWKVVASKTWHLPKFRRFSAEIDYFGGQDLDRFSKYGFGFFGSTRVHGFQSDRVRAEDGFATHLGYGLGVGDTFRLEGVLDVALINDPVAALENELLAGVGIVGQFLGPWRTIVRIDLGVPVAGPDDGFTLNLVFLKLFG